MWHRRQHLDSEIAERRRLARDLHDGLGGMLSVVKLNMYREDNLPKAKELLEQSMIELRRIAHHLMPEALHRYGLKASLEDFCNSVPAVKFRFYGEDVRLDKRFEVLIYHSAYELINNAIKYANAEIIHVQLVQDKYRVSLSVQDNGIGFDPLLTTEGTGLESIKERITKIGGIMNIDSSPTKGTGIYIEITLQHKSEEL